MEIRLHKNARTTPATRAYIQSSTKTPAELAQELGVSEVTEWLDRKPERIYVDKGYIGHDAPKPLRVFRSGQKWGVHGQIMLGALATLSNGFLRLGDGCF